MIIEIGSKWIKDGEVVEVENIKDNHFDNNSTSRTDCLWFWDKQGSIHVLTECDFLEQYKPYEEPKQTVVIEKWLCYDNLAESYSIVEESNIYGFINDDRAYLSKVRLLDTYEVTL